VIAVVQLEQEKTLSNVASWIAEVARSTFVISLMLSLVLPFRAEAASGWPEQKRHFTAALEAAIQQYDIPGAVVGVWTPRGEWIATEGFADLAKEREIRRHDRFGIRSITKSFTVTVILQLVAAGKLSLDDKIARYVHGVPNGHLITIRQLANMTSGLVDYSQVDAFLREFVKDFSRRWANEELLNFAFQKKPRFKPGTRYDYSNTNTVLLGVVIEKVTGKRFDSVLRRLILDRLGLDDTQYLFGASVPRPRALNYLYDEATNTYDSEPVSFTSQGPAGALVSDLDDLRRWGEALAEGTLLPQALQRLRFVAQAPANGPEYDRYGMGIGEIAGYWGHAGEGLGYEALVMHHPTREETIVILVNTSRFKDIPAKMFREFARILML
jgi:D-alanyl-D-alanine carboxypeptidase